MKTTFANFNLNTPLINALEDMGIVRPTPIQEESFAPIMSGRDVLGVAATGTGKTLAFVLPILRRLSFSEQKNPRVVIVAPTRELAVQIGEVVELLTRYMSVRIETVYGGTNIRTQAFRISQGQDIVVATPGRLVDLVLNGPLSLKSVKHLVIDEVDQMFDLGFMPQLRNLLDLLPEKRQNLMFSATLSNDILSLAEDFFFNPIKVQVADPTLPKDAIEHLAYHATNFKTKLNLLEHHLSIDPVPSLALIFADSKRIADLIYESLDNELQSMTGVIHSNKSQNLRLNTLEKLKSGEYKYLITTDLLARGIDVDDLSHVINFTLPKSTTQYIHRVGRSARKQAKGVAMSYVSDYEREAFEGFVNDASWDMIEVSVPNEVRIESELLEFEVPKPLGQKNYMPRVKLRSGRHQSKVRPNKNRKPRNRSSKKRGKR